MESYCNIIIRWLFLKCALKQRRVNLKVINNICAKYSIESLYENLCALNKALMFSEIQR